ncbi:hypothetical protein [Fulvimarina sp. MAC8]|uniref:hypothetical protein n=1 Tax=Fulvimarina sp. MAC8 TaxID=3162874 RepID=UPI0032F0512F
MILAFDRKPSRSGRFGWLRAQLARRRLSAGTRDLLKTVILAGLFIALLIFAIVQTVRLLDEWDANRAIRALATGKAVAIGDGAPAELLLASAYHELGNADLAQAEALGVQFRDEDDPKIRAAFWFALGNARMDTAFEQISDNQIKEATVTIRLAQDDYRRAMRLVPTDFDFKYNFDIASRLVRVFPRNALDVSEEEGERPRDVWTDLPGVPRGLP